MVRAAHEIVQGVWRWDVLLAAQFIRRGKQRSKDWQGHCTTEASPQDEATTA